MEANNVTLPDHNYGRFLFTKNVAKSQLSLLL